VRGELLALGGADLRGGDLSAFEGGEEGVNPRRAREERAEDGLAERGAVGLPIGEQCAGGVGAAELGELRDGGGLDFGGLLGLEQRREGGEVVGASARAATEEADCRLPVDGRL
jgi:hypothetical protein